MVGNKRGAGMRALVLTIAVFCLACTACFAQQSQPAALPDAPSAAQSQTAPQGTSPLHSGASFFLLLQEKSLVFPDLATQTERLDTWQKFKLAANNSVSLATIGAGVVGSAFGQAIDSPAGYGQGAEGYGKRIGAHMARAASGNLFGTFLIASALHEDPRFYVRQNLSFKQSVRYAAVRLVVTRSDSGNRTVNLAGLLGLLAGEGLANTYYPDGSRGVGDTFVRYGSDLAWRFGGNLLRQYWPHINRKLGLLPPAAEPPPAPNQP